ncbi:XRE family transcriptional regulator [Kitasatospora sp. NPDC005748]|uniref:XRE family transcriptional regulator n=1 Tax=Kitasatospora sp. NPDC005748 TaxID=3157063 RepID=UPI0033FBAC85
MSSQPLPPNPSLARDTAEFVAYLRQLRQRSGLTYRALERRAAEVGAVLPRSTIAEALRHDLLPRPELLDAFVRACGLGEDPAVWLAARERLAHEATHPGPGAPAEAGPPAPQTLPGAPRTAPPAPSRRRLRSATPIVVVLALAAAVAGGAAFLHDRAHRPAAPAPSSGAQERALVAAGAYLIRPVGSGLCLGESTTHESGGEVGQFACPGNVPTYVFEPAGGGQYTIRSLHPVMGHGCLGVEAALLADGARLMNDYCGRRGTAERFRLRASPGGAGSYLIQLVHSNACVTIPGDIGTPGVLARQLPCADPPAGQSFTLEPVPAPTAIPDIRTN